MPSASRREATSWGWTPFKTKETTASRSSDRCGPTIWMRSPRVSTNRVRSASPSSRSYRPQLVPPDPFEVVQGGRKRDRTPNVRRTGFEPGRGLSIGRPIEVNFRDHLASSQGGGKRREELGSAPEDADAHGSENLVSREREEVDPQLLDIDREVRDRLGRVQDDEGPHRVGALNDLPNGV